MADAPVLAAVGLAGALLALLDPIPYVRDILRGRTRPYRATWLIWSGLGVLTFCSQLADGGTWSIAAVGVQAASTLFVFVLSIRRGQGGARRTDAALLLLAAGGTVAWLSSSEPVLATVFVIAADALGVALMLPKTWQDPWSETRSSYVLASASGVLSTIAVGALDAALLLYPAYFACANGVTAVVITVGRNRTRASDWRHTGASIGSICSAKNGIASTELPGQRIPDRTLIELGPRLQRFAEQQPCFFPVTTHRAVCDAERFGDFELCHPAEIAHLHHLRHARVQRGHFIERLVHAQNLLLAGHGVGADLRCQRDAIHSGTAPRRVTLTSEVNDDGAHDACRPAHEVQAILQPQTTGSSESQITLVHER
jgi:hypothetical protein